MSGDKKKDYQDGVACSSDFGLYIVNYPMGSVSWLVNTRYWGDEGCGDGDDDDGKCSN